MHMIRAFFPIKLAALFSMIILCAPNQTQAHSDVASLLKNCISRNDIKKVLKQHVSNIQISGFFYRSPLETSDNTNWLQLLDQLETVAKQDAGWTTLLSTIIEKNCANSNPLLQSTEKNTGIGAYLDFDLGAIEKKKKNGSSCACKDSSLVTSITLDASGSGLSKLRAHGSGVIGISLTISRIAENKSWEEFIDKLSKLIYRRRNMSRSVQSSIQGSIDKNLHKTLSLDSREIALLNWLLQQATNTPTGDISYTLAIRSSEGTPGNCCCVSSCQCAETYRGICPCGVTFNCYCMSPETCA